MIFWNYIKKIKQKIKTKLKLRKINKNNKNFCSNRRIEYYRMDNGTSVSRIIKLEKVK